MSKRITKNRCAAAALCGVVALVTAGADAGTVAHWSFDTDFSDVSGLGNDLTTHSGTATNVNIDAADSAFGGASANFTSVRDWLELPGTLTFSDTQAWSVSFWARDLSGTNNGGMVLGQADNTNQFIWIQDGFVRWRGVDSAVSHQQDWTTDTDSSWHHYALIANGAGSILLYKDGVSRGSATGKNTGFTISSVGEAYTSSIDYDWQGQLDEVWVFDNALSAADVSSLRLSNTVASPVPSPAALPTGAAMLGLAGLRRRR